MEGIVFLVNQTSCVSAIRSWVATNFPIGLRCLERNLVFIAFLLSSDQHLSLEFIKDYLTTQNTCSLPRNIQSEFEEFAKAQPTLPAIDREALISHDPLRTVYYELYKDQEHKLMENINGLSALVFKKKKVSL